MSRVAKKPIIIPEKTEVTVNAGTVVVKGPKGSITREFKNGVDIKVENGTVLVTLKRPEDFMLVGTYASHIKNMIKGVNETFVKKLIVEGVGFKSEVKGKSLVLSVGFSHQVIKSIPEGLNVTADKNIITIEGVDKEKVGSFAADVRSSKKPEPYKGKGIRYEKEIIRRKQGKKAA